MGNASKAPAAVANLRVAILEHDRAKAALSKRRADFEASIETESERVKTLESEVENLKDEVTPLAIAEFKETKIKKMWGGIGIQEKTVVSWDSAKALAFAKEKDMFLKLDEAAFKKVAASLGLDFVKTEKVEAVTWPKEWKS